MLLAKKIFEFHARVQKNLYHWNEIFAGVTQHYFFMTYLFCDSQSFFKSFFLLATPIAAESYVLSLVLKQQWKQTALLRTENRA